MDQKNIVEYYDECEVDYRLVWDLDKSQQMHYGYWDSKARTFRKALKRINEVMAEKARITERDHVLDAGCGVGGPAIWLAENIGCKVTGITLSKKQRQTAENNGKKSSARKLLNFEKRDFFKTGFKRESFDVAWAIESSCYAAEKQKFVDEMSRVLKKKGRIVIADFFRAKNKMSPREKRLYKGMVDGWVIEDFKTVRDMKRALEKAGFRVKLFDITKNVTPLAFRLYVAFFPGLFVRTIQNVFSPHKKVIKGNLWTCYYQWKALRKGLWKYYIVLGEK